MNKNEVLFRKSFNISQNFEKLIDGFKFSTDPRDGIKDVKIKDVRVVSLLPITFIKPPPTTHINKTPQPQTS